jgi:integrase/recombinase XerD
MFEKIIKRSYYRKKHIDAPLLNERTKYIQYWADKGRALNTLHGIAIYLLRIVEFLHLESRRTVKLEEIDKAANAWATYQYNHPQKRNKFSKCSKERFTWYAIDWLKKLEWLEPLPEERIPLFNCIFERRHALRRHINAPLLKERLLYLQKWADGGATTNTLRHIAHYLLAVIDFLKLDKKESASPKEIQKAAEKWAARTSGNIYRKKGSSKASERRFKSIATNWLDMIGKLKRPKEKTNPYWKFITQYIDYMRKERGLSEETIYSRACVLKDFFKCNESSASLYLMTPLNIDDVLKKKHLEGQCRRSIQTYASILRTFFTYAEGKKWCQPSLSQSIKTSRVYRHEELPQGPSWDDVQKLIATTEGDRPTNIRDRAILLLLAVYGLRSGEVTQLHLEDLDWENELLLIKRTKTFKAQNFPLSQTVGNAILLYLKKVRPNEYPCREVFLSRRAPYRPLTSSAIFQIVSKRLKPLVLNLKHHGPHALRHACATRLINEGISLKEISDHLGHRSMESTRIYAKVDLSQLRKVADFEISDLI